jgi:hypothetical protein
MTNVDEGTASRLIFATMGVFLGKCCRNAASSADQRIAAKNAKHRTGPSSDLFKLPILKPQDARPPSAAEASCMPTSMTWQMSGSGT